MTLLVMTAKINIKIENFDTTSFYSLSEYHNNSIYKNGGIVFCPHRTHLFGVTDKFKFDKYDDDIRDDTSFGQDTHGYLRGVESL